MEEKYLTLREIQLEELKILKKVVNYIEHKNLRYYISGGTLLGAIRHKGFIPWDDDIDILMPRTDYEEFLNYLKTDELYSDYEVLTLENGKHNRPFCKVINKKVHIYSKSEEDKYLWIDIFPLDGLPASIDKSRKIIKKLLFLKGQIYLRTTSCKEILKERRSIYNRVLKILLKQLTYRHKIIYYSKKIDDIAKKYPYDNSDKVANLAWTDGYKSIYNKVWFTKSLTHEFEDGIFNIPVEWDKYLENLYGTDYMELPPKEDRIDHKITAKKEN